MKPKSAAGGNLIITQPTDPGSVTRPFPVQGIAGACTTVTVQVWRYDSSGTGLAKVAEQTVNVMGGQFQATFTAADVTPTPTPGQPQDVIVAIGNGGGATSTAVPIRVNIQ